MSDLIKWFIITLSASLEHAKQWGASLLSLANEQPTEFVSLDEVNPTPEDNGRTGDDSSAMSSVESLSDRSVSDVDSVQDNPPLGSPELPETQGPVAANLCQEAPPQTPATAAPLPTPTESAAATASQQPPVQERAPELAGLTQNLSATDSSTPLGTSSSATGRSYPRVDSLKLKEMLNRYSK